MYQRQICIDMYLRLEFDLKLPVFLQYHFCSQGIFLLVSQGTDCLKNIYLIVGIYSFKHIPPRFKFLQTLDSHVIRRYIVILK